MCFLSIDDKRMPGLRLNDTPPCLMYVGRRWAIVTGSEEPATTAPNAVELAFSLLTGPCHEFPAVTTYMAHAS